MSFIRNLFSTPTPPPAPNPSAIAAAQGAANEAVARTTARLNRADTYTPFGSVTFSDLGDDRWRVDQTLSPAQQAISSQQEALGQGMGSLANLRLGQIAEDPLDYSGIQDYRQTLDRSGMTPIAGVTDFDAARQAAEDAAFNRVWGRLGTQFADEEAALGTDLANRGITMGSDAYGRELDRFNQRKNDARTEAAYRAIAEGRDAFNNLFATQMQARQQQEAEAARDLQLANLGRQQAIADRQALRAQPMNELAAILQGAPAVNVPQQQPMAGVNVAAPNILGAQSLASNVAANNYAQQMAQQQASLGGLADLGSAYLGRTQPVFGIK